MTEAAVAAESPSPTPPPSIWTKEVRAAFKAAERVVFRFQPRAKEAKSWDPQEVLVEFIRDEQKVEGKPYVPEQRLAFSFEGSIANGYGPEVEVSHHSEYGESHHYKSRSYRPEHGQWHLRLYHGEPMHDATVLSMLPLGAKVIFRVKLDHHTNGYLTRARLHGDILTVDFQKGRQKGTLELDHSYVPMNSARFGA
jgi:hypothetical protein